MDNSAEDAFSDRLAVKLSTVVLLLFFSFFLFLLVGDYNSAEFNDL